MNIEKQEFININMHRLEAESLLSNLNHLVRVSDNQENPVCQAVLKFMSDVGDVVDKPVEKSC